MNAAALAAVGSAVASFGSLIAAACSLWIRWTIRWAELTPLFEFTLTEGQLQVLLLEPVGLELKKVKIRIVDEAGQPNGAGWQPAGISNEEASSVVWGPWEFNTDASTQVSDNRTTMPRTYSRLTGENCAKLALKRAPPPSWMADPRSAATWRADRTENLRITITGSRKPYRSWNLLCYVPPGTSRSR
jgi:hypothetical protein